MKILLFLLLLTFLGCKNDKKESDTKKIIKKTVTSPQMVSTPSLVTSPIRFSDNAGDWYLGFSKPKNFDRNKSYPLIIYLHGGIGTERNDKGVKAYTMFDFLKDSLDFFIASPSGNRYAPWWSQLGVGRIYQSVNFMEENFNINKHKIILAGVSDGATATFALAIQQDSPFAGFIGSCAYPLLFGNQLPISALKRKPMLMFVAGKDRLYPYEKVLTYYQTLKDSGVPIEYKFYPNAEHGFDFKTNEISTIKEKINSWDK